MKTATAKTNVVLVDAVRTPFGKAGSLYQEPEQMTSSSDA
jgi:hypothetical protein